MRVMSQSPDPLARMHTKTKRQGKSGAIDAPSEGGRGVSAGAGADGAAGVLEAEMTEALGAEKGERAAGRQGYRSGYYGRTLITRVGKLELRVPQDRTGRFSTELFERYQRSERALVAALADVRARGFDPESEGDHRGAVRPQLFGFLDQRNESAAGCESGAICRPPSPKPSPI
jgi:hypothetical protein